MGSQALGGDVGESLRTRGNALKPGRPINIVRLGAERRDGGKKKKGIEELGEEPLPKGRISGEFPALPNVIIWKRLGSSGLPGR